MEALLPLLILVWDRAGLGPPAIRGAVDDGRVSLTELRGYPVVLNFWASWCIPCKEEAPYFAAAARAHRDKVAFLGLDIQELEASIAVLLAEPVS